MLFLSNEFFDGESVIYRCRKGRLRIIADILFILIGVVCFKIGFDGVKKYFITHKINFQMQVNYYMMAFGMICIAFALTAMVSYILDTFIITENFIIFRRTLKGRVYKIRKTQITAKRNIITHRGGESTYKIQFLTSESNIVDTGDLHCTKRVFNELSELLNYTSASRKEELKNISIEQINNSNCGKETTYNSNIILLVFIYSLYFVLAGCIILYACGINEKFGLQKKFTIEGRGGKCTGTYKGSSDYSVGIVNDSNQKLYWIDVDKDTYNSIDENQEIEVSGKVGSLGVIYNINFTNDN